MKLLRRLFGQFRQQRWFWPVLVGSPVAVVLLLYFIAVQLCTIAPALKPTAILHNPLAVITKTSTSADRATTGHNSASGQSSNKSHPTGSSSPKLLGASTAKPGSTQFASPHSQTSSGALIDHNLILSQSTLTIASVAAPGSSFRPSTYITAPEGVQLSQPKVEGSMADVGVVILPTEDGNGYINQTWNSRWLLYAERSHPEGSGTSYFTVTAHDSSGNVYSALLTVVWPTIPYFTLSNAHAEIVHGNDTLWGPYTGVVLHATITTYNNFGNPTLTLSGFNYPFDCSALSNVTPSYPSKFTYNGQTDLAEVCWIGSTQESQLRTAPHYLTMTVTSDLYTSFNIQSTPVTVPPW